MTDDVKDFTEERKAAEERRAKCAAHRINPDNNNWCDPIDRTGSCDTGDCSDCGKPVFYSNQDGWYHHLDASAQCFLIGAEDSGSWLANGTVEP